MQRWQRLPGTLKLQVTCLYNREIACRLAAGESCWIADSQGQVGCLNLKLGKVQQSLKGVAGSVRSLVVHEEANVIVSAGLDRYLRLHDIATRKPIAR